jgi:hypothetical protein
VDEGHHLVTGEKYANTQERERLGAYPRGGERAAWRLETLGSLQVAQVLRLSLDTITRVHAVVYYSYVEH